MLPVLSSPTARCVHTDEREREKQSLLNDRNSHRAEESTPTFLLCLLLFVGGERQLSVSSHAAWKALGRCGNEEVVVVQSRLSATALLRLRFLRLLAVVLAHLLQLRLNRVDVGPVQAESNEHKDKPPAVEAGKKLVFLGHWRA